MNTPLVDALVQAILALPKEECELLEEKLHRKMDWRATLQQIDKLRAEIHAERGGKPFDPPIEEYIHQTREERNQQQDEFMRNLFSEPEAK